MKREEKRGGKKRLPLGVKEGDGGKGYIEKKPVG